MINHKHKKTKIEHNDEDILRKIQNDRNFEDIQFLQA